MACFDTRVLSWCKARKVLKSRRAVKVMKDACDMVWVTPADAFLSHTVFTAAAQCLSYPQLIHSPLLDQYS